MALPSTSSSSSKVLEGKVSIYLNLNRSLTKVEKIILSFENKLSAGYDEAPETIIKKSFHFILKLLIPRKLNAILPTIIFSTPMY